MTVAEVRTESRTSLRNSILRVDTIPLERELEERLGFFVHLRWLAGAGILVGAWVSIEILGADYSYVPLILIGTGVLAYNGLCLSTRRVGASHIYAQIAFDWVALTALVYYTGGVRSPVSLAYSFHIVLGALLLPGVAAWLQAGTASAVIGLMTTAEHFGWWLPIDGQIGLLFPATAHLQCWATLTAFFGISAYLTGSISSALRRKERAVADSQTRLDLAYHEMEALFELGQIAHASLNLEQVLRLIVRRATELMGAKGCSIGLLDHTGQFLEPSASFGLSEAYLSKGSVDVQRSAMVAQALAGEVVQVQDIAADLRLQYPDRARAEGIRAIVCVALQLRSHPIGVIRVYASKSAPAGDRQVAFLRNLANLAAVAIGSARTYAESEALSDERAWFARTTHHQLQTPLAAMVG
ncbi:MAG: GAF domain-containing protein, partial [Gemmatimonadetes bacterium]|nr:GAF domain-containing protein [Gemmatimonadota bacterium]